MSNITVKNVSTALVTLSVGRFRRELQPGRIVPISQSVYEDMMYDPGINNLIRGHYIVIDGVDKAQAVISEDAPIIEPAEIKEMYSSKNYTKFARFIPTATAAEKDAIVQLAIDNGVTDNGFTALIKKYCGVDVISAINRKHQIEND